MFIIENVLKNKCILFIFYQISFFFKFYLFVVYKYYFRCTCAPKKTMWLWKKIMIIDQKVNLTDIFLHRATFYRKIFEIFEQQKKNIKNIWNIFEKKVYFVIIYAHWKIVLVYSLFSVPLLYMFLIIFLLWLFQQLQLKCTERFWWNFNYY